MKSLSKAIFITGTGTDIGKTFVLEKIYQDLIKKKQKVLAIKPVISGFNINDNQNDCARILTLSGKPVNEDNLNDISLYRFSAPLSPDIAAQLENKIINFLAIKKFCQKKITAAQNDDGYLLIEGAGGVMTPVCNNKTFANLIAALKIPAILVIGNYLGTISHTLSAVKTMQYYKIDIKKIILNCCQDDSIRSEETLRTLQKFTKIKISNQIYW